MKYRIVQLGTGKFLVQRRRFMRWQDMWWQECDTFEEAEAFIRLTKDRERIARLREDRKVVREYE